MLLRLWLKLGLGIELVLELANVNFINGILENAVIRNRILNYFKLYTHTNIPTGISFRKNTNFYEDFLQSQFVDFIYFGFK